jgi:hypothetical protein
MSSFVKVWNLLLPWVLVGILSSCSQKQEEEPAIWLSQSFWPEDVRQASVSFRGLPPNKRETQARVILLFFRHKATPSALGTRHSKQDFDSLKKRSVRTAIL